jgi:hypothetical protein
MASIRFFMIVHRPVDAMRRHDKPRVIDPAHRQSAGTASLK